MNLRAGIIGSGLWHLVLVAFFIFAASAERDKFLAPTIYSVTLEGGKSLGGISQVEKDPKSVMAPPKNVKSEPKKKVEPEPKKETKPEKKEKAEVSIPKNPEKKPTPKATAKPTPAKPKEPTAAELNKQYEAAMQRYSGESTAASGTGFGSGKLGGNRMGGGTIRPPEFFAYKKLLEDHIKGGWRWYDSQAILQAQVSFAIAENGEIFNVRIESRSGIREFDDSALRAVMKANPAPAPPSNVYQFFKEVRITFDPQD